jgi:Uma2 family endonuclease
VGSWFFRRERQWNIRAVVGQAIEVAPERYRIADVAVLDCAHRAEQIIHIYQPLIVIEVLSPKDTWVHYEDHIADYLKFGIPNIWILDPASRRGWMIYPGERQLVSTFAVPDSPITVSLDELFAEAGPTAQL